MDTEYRTVLGRSTLAIRQHSRHAAAAENHYPDDDRRGNLPSSQFPTCVSPINAHLHLWTTNAFLESAFTVMRAWGFEYKSILVWVKPNIDLRNYWRVSHEYLRDRIFFWAGTAGSGLAATIWPADT